jgi:hypothetical protein
LFILAILAIFTTPAFAADLLLKATWTPNTDSATGYKLYRVDGTRTLIGTIPGRATALYNFTLTVPDGSTGTARFVMTATTATKESVDSAVALFPFDLTPVPAAPGNLGVTVQ